MRELEYLKIINNTLADSSLLGDDCAYIDPSFLGSSGIYVTQDSLVEDVHFSLNTITPYLLGKKSVNVNLSDLAAACAKPLFITISLSLPIDCDGNFVSEFYRGVNEVCQDYDVKVAGGDITGSDTVFISVCAVGSKCANYKISRCFAKDGDVVVITGNHGDSAAGYLLLKENNKASSVLVDAHLSPNAQVDKSKIISQVCDSDFAMMDTSDGLADALYKIADASDVCIEVDLDDVPISSELKKTFPDSYKNLALWGGEDYQLLCCVSKSVYEKLDKYKFFKIGVVKKSEGRANVKIKDGCDTLLIDEDIFDKNSFNHFTQDMSEDRS